MNPQLQQSLTDILAEVAPAAAVPGAAVGVLHRGQLTDAAYGTLNLRTGVDATTDSLFQIGSITKMWTAALVFQLVDDGLVELDRPVQQYLPEFVIADPAATASITVGQLLSHRGGFDGDYFTDTGRGSDAIEKFVASLEHAEQFFAPGEQFAYNNAGWVVLGRLVEVLRGDDYVRVVADRLFTPLGLQRAVALPEDALLHRTAAGHTRGPDGVALPMGSWSLPFSTAPTGAALTMSVGDLLRFAEIFLRDGRAADGTRILSADSARAIWQPQLTTPAPGFVGDHFGMGAFTFDYDGGSACGHDGQTVGQTAYLRIVPDHDLAFAVLTNRDGPIQLFEALAGHILGTLTPMRLTPVPEPPAAPLPVDAGLIAGNYTNNSLTAEVFVDDGRPFIRLGSPTLDLGHQPAMPLAALGPATYVSEQKGDAPAIPFHFLDTDGDGAADFLYFMRMLKRVG